MKLFGHGRDDRAPQRTKTATNPDETRGISVADQVDVSIRHHVGTIAMLAAIGVLGVSLSINTWWSLRASTTNLQQQIEQSARRAATNGASRLARLQARSLANVGAAADAVLDGPIQAQAATVAMLIDAAEADGRTRTAINNLLRTIAIDTGALRIEGRGGTGRTYTSAPAGNAGPPPPDLAERLDHSATATTPSRSGTTGLEKAGAAGRDGLWGGSEAWLRIGLDLQEETVQYGTDRDTGARRLTEAAAAAVARTATEAIEVAQIAGWGPDRIRTWLEESIASSPLHHVMASDSRGRAVHEAGRRRWTNLAQRRAADVRQTLARDGSGSAGLLGHLTEQRRLIANGIASRNYSEGLTTRIAVGTHGNQSGLRDTAWQLEADELAANEDIDQAWIVILDQDPATRILAAAPRRNEDAEENVWLAWTDDHDREARRAAATEAATSTADASILRVHEALVIAAAPVPTTSGENVAIVIQQRAQAAVTSMRDVAFVGLRTASVLILFVGSATAFASRRWLTRPIEAMADAARCLTAGERPPDELTAGLGQRRDEIGSLARNFDEMTVEVLGRQDELQKLVDARTIELRTSNASLQETDVRRRRELELAKTLQQGFISTGERSYGTIHVASRMTPARELGGDFVSVVERPDKSVCVAICDVSGKGLGAALFMVAAQSALTAAASRGADVREIADETNRRLQQGNELGMFVTAVIGVLNPTNGQFDYVCAGHEPPITLSADGKTDKLSASGGIPLGLPKSKDKYNKRIHKLAPGETIVAYTDGIPDACNEEDEEYGEKRLRRLLTENGSLKPDRLIHRIWDALRDFTGLADATDDKTCLVIQRERRARRGRDRTTEARKNQQQKAGSPGAEATS